VTQAEIINLIGQFVGFIAIAVAFLSFQAKKKGAILAIQALANCIWGIHYFMIGAMAGCILNLAATGRNLIFAKRDSCKWLHGIWLPTVVAIIIAALSIFTRETWFDVILLPSTILSTYAYCLGNERVIRNSTVFVSLTWLIFNIVSFSVSGVIAEIFNLTSLTIAIIRFRNRTTDSHKKLSKNENTATNEDIAEENI
jgi:hypothetical protein